MQKYLSLVVIRLADLFPLQILEGSHPPNGGWGYPHKTSGLPVKLDHTSLTHCCTRKAIYKNVLAKTQKECKEKLAAALEQAGKVDASKGQFTVGQWAETWFENYAKPSIRETTAAYYKNYIDKHIVPNIGKIKLNKLTTLDIQKFYNKAKTKGRVKRYEGVKDLPKKRRRCRHSQRRKSAHTSPPQRSMVSFRCSTWN